MSDNTYWNDLVNAGWSPGWDGAVWFYKVDLDPAFVTEHPEGWRSIDYLVWNSTISGNSNAIPLMRQAYEHSVLLATFGEDRHRGDSRGHARLIRRDRGDGTAVRTEGGCPRSARLSK